MIIKHKIKQPKTEHVQAGNGNTQKHTTLEVVKQTLNNLTISLAISLSAKTNI